MDKNDLIISTMTFLGLLEVEKAVRRSVKRDITCPMFKDLLPLTAFA